MFAATVESTEGTVLVNGIKCVNIYDALSLALKKRGASFEDLHLIKLGIDSGRDSLKVSVSMVLSSEIEERDGSVNPSRRRSYEDSLSATSKFLSTSANRVFIIALFPLVGEKHGIIRQLIDWKLLEKIRSEHDVTVSTALDFKCLLVVIGLQTATSSFPCPFCLHHKTSFPTLATVTEPRTFEGIRDSNQRWLCETGGDVSKLKLYHNSMNEPLPLFKEGPVIQHCPPPELHVFIGIVNKLVDLLLIVIPQTTKAWLSQNHIKVERYHGGTLEGNQSRKVLKNAPKLNAAVETRASERAESEESNRENYRVSVLVIDCLGAFEKVVSACFAWKLKPDFEKAIEIFRRKYSALALEESLRKKGNSRSQITCSFRTHPAILQRERSGAVLGVRTGAGNASCEVFRI